MMGIITQFLTLGSSILFFGFGSRARLVWSAISVGEAPVGSGAGVGVTGIGVGAGHRRGQPDPSGIVVVTYNMVAILVFPSTSSAPAAVGVADEVSSGGFRWHPPFEISPRPRSWRKTTRV